MIRFRALGGLDLRDDGGSELRSLLAQPKRVALLTYIALEAINGFCRRDRLIALFWPEFDTDRARKALRQALHFVRRTLGGDVLVSRGDEEIGLANDLIWCDAVAFQNAVSQRRARDALELYAGDLLPGFFVSDVSAEFEQWLERQRHRLRLLAAAAAWTVSADEERAGNALEAARLGREAVRLAPDDENGVRRLIGLLDRLGDRAGALRTYDSFAQRLRQEFDLEPAAETRGLVESVRTRKESTATPTSTSRVPSAFPDSSPPPPKREEVARGIGGILRAGRSFWAIAGISAAVLLGVVVLWPRNPSDAVPLLAVGWIDNEAGANSDETARLLPGLLSTDLSRVRGLTVVSDARLYEVLGQLGTKPENAQLVTDAARRAGADELLQGVLYRRRAGLRLDLRRVDLRSGVVRATYTAEGADAFELTDRAVANVARDFSLDAPQLAESGTRSLAARRLYEEGLRALFRGEPRRGHDLFAAAVREDSTFAMAAYHAGATREKNDDSTRAYYARAIRLSERAPERDRLIIRLGTVGADQALYLAVAETLAARFPNEPDGHMTLLTIRFVAGDFLSAASLAQRVIAMDSLSLTGNTPMCRACQAYSFMVDAYVHSDSLAAAERVARDWIRRQPTSGPAWRHLGSVLNLSGQHAAALVAFHEADKRQPSPETIHWLVQGAISASNFAEADRLLRARLQYDPQDENALWYLVISLRHQGRLREALTLAERMQATSTEFSSRLAHAQVLFESRQFRQAAARFDSVAHFFRDTVAGPMDTRGRIARHLSWNHTHAATALAAAGDTIALLSLTDSIATIARLSSYGRDWRLPDHLRGLAWLARGQPERAVPLLRAAIYSPTAGYTRTNLELGRALIALNRPAEAVAILQSALRGGVEASNYYVTRTELHELLGRSFQLANQRDSAASHYRRVVAAWSQGDPEFRARADSARKRLAAFAR